MRRAFYFLVVPALWAFKLHLLFGFIVVHILAAPVRAFIYWARSLEANPGWVSRNESEVGIWCHRRDTEVTP